MAKIVLIGKVASSFELNLTINKFNNLTIFLTYQNN